MALNLIPNEFERILMVTELHVDLECDCFGCSPRLTPQACEEYPMLVDQAVLNEDCAWLESKLLSGRLVTDEPCARCRNGFKQVNQRSAARMLAEGTWNNLWCRCQCRRAIEVGSDEVEVFRVALRTEPRWESEQMVGRVLDAHELLEDLRGRACDYNSGLIPVPGGPNSGISVRACLN